jgi:hypothetical protein
MKPVFTITNEIADALTRIERARGFLEAAKRSDGGLQAMTMSYDIAVTGG